MHVRKYARMSAVRLILTAPCGPSQLLPAPLLGHPGLWRYGNCPQRRADPCAALTTWLVGIHRVASGAWRDSAASAAAAAAAAASTPPPHPLLPSGPCSRSETPYWEFKQAAATLWWPLTLKLIAFFKIILKKKGHFIICTWIIMDDHNDLNNKVIRRKMTSLYLTNNPNPQ